MKPQLMPVPFYEDTVLLVGQANETYVSMRPIASILGRDRKAHVKIVEKFDPTLNEMMTTGGEGKQYAMTCLLLRKLLVWVYSINLNTVSSRTNPRATGSSKVQ